MPGTVACGVVASIVAPDRDGFGFRELGQAEVEDLGAIVRGDEDVLRLQVAVDDALLVCGGESEGDLPRVLHGLAHGQRLRPTCDRAPWLPRAAR